MKHHRVFRLAWGIGKHGFVIENSHLISVYSINLNIDPHSSNSLTLTLPHSLDPNAFVSRIFLN